MSTQTKQQRLHQRRDTALSLFEEEGWGNLELLDDWDGENLDELRSLLNEEEFQKLLDRLQDQGERG